MVKLKLNTYKGRPPYDVDDLVVDPHLERRQIKRERREAEIERQQDRRSKRQDKRKQFY